MVLCLTNENKFVTLQPKGWEYPSASVCNAAAQHGSLYHHMCDLESLKIDLKGVGEGGLTLHYDLGDSYFEAMDSPLVSKGSVCVDVSIKQTAGFYEMRFHTEGCVTVPCDICLEPMSQPVCTDNRLTVKFGEEYSEDDDLVTVDKNEGLVDIAWFVYEFIALGIPLKHVHAPGDCNREMTEMLKEHSAARSSDAEDGEAIDPRWSELKKLRNNN